MRDVRLRLAWRYRKEHQKLREEWMLRITGRTDPSIQWNASTCGTRCRPPPNPSPVYMHSESTAPWGASFQAFLSLMQHPGQMDGDWLALESSSHCDFHRILPKNSLPSLTNR